MKRILIVDDEDAILEALQDVLVHEGYEVSTAIHGAHALEQLERAPLPDVVLLDLMMPVMDGHTLLGRLRADPARQHLPVVLMSAGRVRPEERRAAQHFLAKPFELEQLLRTLQEVLEPAPAARPPA